MMQLDKKNYVKQAEDVIKKLNRDKRNNIILTTSKIRNLLSMISNIYNEANNEKENRLNEEIQSNIQYLKMRFVYEVGRDPRGYNGVRDFVNKSKIIECIDQIGSDKENFLLFCKYMEALVAYHKYYGGRD